MGSAGFSCGCPQGYQRIGQGHCLSTITPATAGYGDDIGDVPTYPIGQGGYGSASNDKLITTEGCFSCKVNIIKTQNLLIKFKLKVNGRHRRNSRHSRLYGRSNANDTINHIFKRSRRLKRHHHGEDLELKISLAQTKHRMRVIKIQPSVKVKV